MAKGWSYLQLPLGCGEQNQTRQSFAVPALEGSPLASFPWSLCRATQFGWQNEGWSLGNHCDLRLHCHGGDPGPGRLPAVPPAQHPHGVPAPAGPAHGECCLQPSLVWAAWPHTALQLPFCCVSNAWGVCSSTDADHTLLFLLRSLSFHPRFESRQQVSRLGTKEALCLPLTLQGNAERLEGGRRAPSRLVLKWHLPNLSSCFLIYLLCNYDEADFTLCSREVVSLSVFDPLGI